MPTSNYEPTSLMTMNHTCLAICSKPSDVLMAEEASSRLGSTPHYVVILESRSRHAVTTKIVQSMSRTYDTVSSTDLFTLLMARVNNRSKLQKAIAYCLSLLFGAIWKYFIERRNYQNVWRHHRKPGYVILDLWRTKISSLAWIDPHAIIVIDGGLSTKHLGLLPINGRSSRQVISDYLKAQITVDYRKKGGAVGDLFFRKIRGRFYSLRRNEERRVLAKFSTAKTCVFSIYAENEQSKEISFPADSTKVTVASNDLSGFRSRVETFEATEEVWIAGHPGLLHLEEQMQLVNKNSLAIKYFVHPRDRQLMRAGSAMARNYFEAAAEHKFQLVTAEEPLEWYLLSHATVPKELITYRATSLVEVFNKLGIGHILKYAD